MIGHRAASTLFRAVFLAVFLASAGVLVASRPTLDSSLLVALTIMAMVPFGVWLTMRRPRSPVGWIFLAAGTLVAVQGAAGALVANHGDGPWTGVPLWALWWSQIGWYLILALCLVHLPLLYPDGPLSRRWRSVAIGLAIGQGAVVVAFATGQTLEPAPGILVPNPLALPTPVLEQTVGSYVFGTAMVLLVVGLMLAVISLFLRSRRGGAVVREQVRWFLAATLFLLMPLLLSALLRLSETAVDVLLAIGIVALQVACGVAILKYRLFEIDRIVSRTVSYAVVTGVVLGTYGLVVTSVSWLLPESGALPVAGATLVAAGVFRPVLRRVRDRVDRRFDRARFDGVRAAEAFAGRVGSAVDPDEVAADLVGTVQATLAPRSVGVWLAGGR